MDKPISVILTELNDNIIQEIKQSNLHPMIVEPIIRDIYNMVLESARKQKEFEKEAYEKSNITKE